MATRLVIACDHGGFELKEQLKAILFDVDVTDFGTNSTESVDYPEFAHKVADAITSGQADCGILVCGTGIGMSMAANRHAGIRAAICTDSFSARMTREHNDANVLCLGARVVGPGLAEEIVRTFLSCEFTGGRHAGRIAKIEIK